MATATLPNMATSTIAFPSVDFNLLKDLAKKYGWQILSTSKSDECKSESISPKLQAQIDEARAEFKRGETLHFDNAETMNDWLDSL